MGAPSIFTEEIALAICERIAEGDSLRTICADEEMPAIRTIMKWLSDDKHPEFVQQYVRAREAQADRMAEEILSIADTPVLGVTTKVHEDGKKEVTEGDMIQHRRLQVDSRKWLASKLAPKKYGERLHQDINHSGEINTISDERLESRILELAGKAGIASASGGEGPQE